MTLGRWFWNPLIAVVLLSIYSAGGAQNKLSEADMAVICPLAPRTESYDTKIS